MVHSNRSAGPFEMLLEGTNNEHLCSMHTILTQPNPPTQADWTGSGWFFYSYFAHAHDQTFDDLELMHEGQPSVPETLCLLHLRVECTPTSVHDLCDLVNTLE